VIGDAVNTASRVETATRETGDVVLITDSTRAALTEGGSFALEPRGVVELKGKRDQVRLWAPAPVAKRVSEEPLPAPYIGETRPASIS
jgi:adenylate cyclase